MLPELLSQGEIKSRYSKLQNWKLIDDHHLIGFFKFENFAAALDFTRKVGEIAEKMQHHPEIDLSWGNVEVTIFTHDRDGLTKLDFDFAIRVDQKFAMADEDEFKKLMALLEHGDFLEQREAARKLGSLRDPRAVPALLKALDSPDDIALSRRAARSLGRLNDRRAVDPLIDKLYSDDDLLRQYAKDSLVELDDFSVLGLMKILKSENKRARKLAVEAIIEIRDGEALENLEKVE
ncbi:MAG TPA: 4a-hydroxytetrahydrobiopterin dehydratase [Methanobacteriaceae archaeon]|nr:4a-hydroxytetrahydrobiopterin dehydratase [Methanobacteriaceae archaeon]